MEKRFHSRILRRREKANMPEMEQYMKKISLKRIMILAFIVLLIVENQPQKTFSKEERVSSKKENTDTYFYSNSSIVFSTKEGEMLIGTDAVWQNNGGLNKLKEKYKGKCNLNQQQLLKKISFHNANELQVCVSKYGAAIEPISGNEIEIYCVGADDKNKVAVSTSKENQKLTVNIKGAEKHTFYINPSEHTRANTIKIGIPKKLFKKINIDGDTGSTIVSKTNTEINGKSKSGIIIVKDDTISKKITLNTGNGTVRVGATQIRKEIFLNCLNGGAIIDADTVTGKVKMQTTNGTVNLRAGSLSESKLKAANGTVNAKVGTLTGDTEASVSNGVLRFELTKEPKNLKFVLNGTANKWLPNWKLPAGWKNGHTVGNGKPVLTLKAASNGVLKFDVAK